MTHSVMIRKMYIDHEDGRRTEYKWRFDCTCGAGGMSWSWARWYDLIESGMAIGEWMDEQGMTSLRDLETGALPMALDHLRKKAKEATQ